MADVMIRTYGGDSQRHAVLLIFAFYEPVRTLMVTYRREESGASA